jgi:hypothetical protein
VNTNHICWVHGVDFSGAQDAGRRIWIATCTIKGKLLEVEQIRPGESLPHSGRQRERCLEGLRDFISKEKESIIGLDFPFGLPAKMIKQPSWEDFILSFPKIFVSPQEFKLCCLREANGLELKRATDWEQKTPFSPYNLRLYRQTYYGVRDLICPLVRDRLAYFLPMQTPSHDKGWIIEICPAATLKKEKLYSPYKGKSKMHYYNRLLILKRLKIAGLQISQSDLRSKILRDSRGDALDSLIAAFAAFRALGNLFPSNPPQQVAYNMEGYVHA